LLLVDQQTGRSKTACDIIMSVNASGWWGTVQSKVPYECRVSACATRMLTMTMTGDISRRQNQLIQIYLENGRQNKTSVWSKFLRVKERVKCEYTTVNWSYVRFWLASTLITFEWTFREHIAQYRCALAYQSFLWIMQFVWMPDNYQSQFWISQCILVHSNSPKIILIRFTPENRFESIQFDRSTIEWWKL